MSRSPSLSSPNPSLMSPVVASTAASSPPPSEDHVLNHSDLVSSRQISEAPLIGDDEQFRDRFARLERLLEKSSAYSKVIGQQMDTEALRAAMAVADSASKPRSTNQPKRKRVTGRPRTRARVSVDSDHDQDHVHPAEEDNTGPKPDPDSNGSEPVGPRPKFLQPSLVTGATLKDYQLEGVEWMVSLDKNGVSGILADEMGLGKTLQTIAFNAYLRELNHYRPFLIVCPLSVAHNWIEEFRRFAPSIPVCLYYGTPAERAELRKTVMRQPDDGSEGTARPFESVMVKKAPTPSQQKSNRGVKSKAPARRESRLTSKRCKLLPDDDYSNDGTSEGKGTPLRSLPKQTRATFPVVVTTYEIIIRDRPHLSKYNWGYIVVDEGHRLKNLNCKLMQEIKRYTSAGRMILTGTPLHNNLTELWSLLNFILPDIFDDLDTFQEWFNLGTLQSRLSPSQSTQLLHTIHGILKPFLLRRLKVDVLGQTLPPKKEYVIYAPLSVRQRKIYNAIVEGTIRGLLLARGGTVSGNGQKPVIDLDGPRQLRKKRKYNYDESSDDEPKKLEKDDVEPMSESPLASTPPPVDDDMVELGRQYQLRQNIKGINNLRLQNTVMQLRKACSHPLLFDASNSKMDREQEPWTTEDLVDSSGKMMVLERLLDELFARGHKVLLFSQFRTVLDIIETWATELKGWDICRIDGLTAPLERREQMNVFQQSGDGPDAPRLFLLSTRAGGLGINLTAADTVIFYDQDWNPQIDLQAQDRAHRIGQTKPVLIFRLVTAHSVEERIMHRASEKRKLEALVIAKGKFKMPGQMGRTKQETLAEMTAALLKLESEHIEVAPVTKEGKRSLLSDKDLEMLLDRSDAVFSNRGKGWSAGGGIAHTEGRPEGKIDEDRKDATSTVPGKKTAFAVYEAPTLGTNEWVANIMGEEVAE